MKPKKNLKLSLKKNTVSDLDSDFMKVVQGGNVQSDGDVSICQICLAPSTPECTVGCTDDCYTHIFPLENCPVPNVNITPAETIK